MRRVVFSLLLFCAINGFAENTKSLQEPSIAEVQISQLFDKQYFPDIKTLIDLVDREDKVSACVEEYIKKQSKSYSKIVQNNLYDLIHNFDRIASKIYGKKPQEDEISREDKIGALAIVQCEAYYTIGILK